MALEIYRCIPCHVIAPRTCFFEDSISFTVRIIAACTSFSKLDIIYHPENCRALMFFEGSMSFSAENCRTRLFSKARCHFRCGKLPQALAFRRLDVIYNPEICRSHFFFKGSVSFTIQKMAGRTCFSKSPCHSGCAKLPRALVFRRLDLIYGPEKGSFPRIGGHSDEWGIRIPFLKRV